MNREDVKEAEKLFREYADCLKYLLEENISEKEISEKVKNINDNFALKIMDLNF